MLFLAFIASALANDPASLASAWQAGDLDTARAIADRDVDPSDLPEWSGGPDAGVLSDGSQTWRFTRGASGDWLVEPVQECAHGAEARTDHGHLVVQCLDEHGFAAQPLIFGPSGSPVDLSPVMDLRKGFNAYAPQCGEVALGPKGDIYVWDFDYRDEPWNCARAAHVSDIPSAWDVPRLFRLDAETGTVAHWDLEPGCHRPVESGRVACRMTR